MIHEVSRRDCVTGHCVIGMRKYMVEGKVDQFLSMDTVRKSCKIYEINFRQSAKSDFGLQRLVEENDGLYPSENV